MKINKNVIFSALLGVGVFVVSSIKDNIDKKQEKEENREWMRKEIASQLSEQNVDKEES